MKNKVLLTLLFISLVSLLFLSTKVKAATPTTLENIIEITPTEICRMDRDKNNDIHAMQGVYFFEKDNKAYAVYAGYNSVDTNPITITLVDLDTCSIVLKDKSITMGHANDITYNADQDMFYVTSSDDNKEVYGFRIKNNQIVYYDLNPIPVNIRMGSFDYDNDNKKYYIQDSSCNFHTLPFLKSTDIEFLAKFPCKYVDTFGDEQLIRQGFSYSNNNIYFARTIGKQNNSPYYNNTYITVFNATNGEYRYSMHFGRDIIDAHIEGITVIGNKVYMGFNINDSPQKQVFFVYDKLNQIEKKYKKPTVTSYNGVYDESSHTITATGEGTLEYSTDNETWSTTKPTRTSVGTTTVYVRVKANANYQESETVQGTITISKLQLTKPTMSTTTFTYSGNEITPTITNIDTNRMTTSGTLKSTNAGDYTITVTLKDKTNTIWKDNTTTNITFNWKINKATRQAPTVTSYNGPYDGASHTITATGNGILEYSTDQTTWSTTKPTRTSVGTTTVYVRVIGDANHNDSSVVTGTIKITTDSDYEIDEYDLDDENDYISNIPPNTLLDEFIDNISLGEGYTVEVDYKEKDNKKIIYTGGKTTIKKNGVVYKEYTNIVPGDTNGDGDIGYLDYVKVYNHIQKEKNPSSNKNLLTGAYKQAADISNDNKISYLDYVKIYNKIKELKGGRD